MQALVLMTGACATTPTVQSDASTSGPEPSLEMSYGGAMSRCWATLTLYPYGRFKTSVHFDDKDHERSGKVDTVYWDQAVGALITYGVKKIESIDANYSTVPPDA